MRLNFLLCIITWSIYACQPSKDQLIKPSERNNLSVDVPVSSELLKHKTDTFRINLREGVFVYGYANQVSVDVVVTILGPGDNKLKTFDSPARGPESFQFETEKNGIHKIIISPLQENEGSYVMLLLGVEKIESVPGNYKGLRKMSHGGADAGYRSYLLRFPDQKFSVSVLCNLASFDPGEIAYKIADLNLADEMVIGDTRSTSTETEKEDTIILVNPDILASYCGRYELFPGFVLTIEIDGDQLQVRAPNQPTLLLDAVSDTEFLVHDMDGVAFVFPPDEPGVVNRLIFRQNDQESTAKRLPPFNPSTVDLSTYTGNYYSQELLTAYDLEVIHNNHLFHEDSLFLFS